jgi:hypothetical protein
VFAAFAHALVFMHIMHVCKGMGSRGAGCTPLGIPVMSVSRTANFVDTLIVGVFCIVQLLLLSLAPGMQGL